MDAAFFLRQRTRFIHNYYITGVRLFREIKRKIDAEESPYDEPPSSFDPEYGEPARGPMHHRSLGGLRYRCFPIRLSSISKR